MADNPFDKFKKIKENEFKKFSKPTGSGGTITMTLMEDGTFEIPIIDDLRGDKGDKGDDGRGVKKATINTSGVLIVTYTDGSEEVAGKAVGKDGTDGKDGAQGRDGSRGIQGSTGKTGIDGKDGVGVKQAQINKAGELIFIFEDGDTQNLGQVVGKDGRGVLSGGGGGGIKLEGSARDRSIPLITGTSGNWLRSTQYSLPYEDGTAGQVLSTDGNGQLTWVDVAAAEPETANNRTLEDGNNRTTEDGNNRVTEGT